VFTAVEWQKFCCNSVSIWLAQQPLYKFRLKIIYYEKQTTTNITISQYRIYFFDLLKTIEQLEALVCAPLKGKSTPAKLKMYLKTVQRKWNFPYFRDVPGSIAGGVTGFFSDIFPSDRTMALGSTQPLVKMSTRNVPGGKDGRCVRLTTSPPSRAECHEIWEPKTSWNPLGHTGSVTGIRYLHLYRISDT
jgi:hypothetical protein